ncbi:leucine-rich_repeat domain-containing protein [Hexamita inflata]|uniref:Leucine-rich_repeat domain-containing protein n=1 Tax=Hexamita inflata TaxID=28002 RepID=A0ABP1GJX2_9EUKA
MSRQNISIQFLSSLTELDLSGNNISDISSISKLKNLKILYLGSNRIEDISGLQSLPDLTHLKINLVPTHQLCQVQLNYHSTVTSYKINLGYSIRLNQRYQKPQIYVLSVSYTV